MKGIFLHFVGILLNKLYRVFKIKNKNRKELKIKLIFLKKGD